MIGLRNVSITKSGQKLFQNLNWQIADHENWVVRGSNGSGKTTLLELLAGVITPSDGEVHYDFIKGDSWEERYKQRKQLIHYIPADAVLTQIHQHDLFYQQRYYSLGDELVPSVKDFLGEEMVNAIHRHQFPASLSIDHLMELKLTRLSNGQQKRVMILKNLALQIPKVLVLDYPFEALDRKSRKDLADFLDHLSKEHDVQIILTDHDEEIPSFINQEIWLQDGQLLESYYHAKQLFDWYSISDLITESTSDPIVQMKNLSIQYGEKVIVQNLNWTINKGERWILSGKNGSGKTTLFSLIFADHPLAYREEVYLFGKRRGGGESIWDIKNRITYLGPEQMSYLDPKDKLLTASDYILPLQKKQSEKALKNLVSYFGASLFIHKPLRMLSAGQLQLVLILKSFLFQKELLLLDEPFRFLDPAQKLLVQTYLQVHLDKDTTLVMITHDEKDITYWGKQIMTL